MSNPALRSTRLSGFSPAILMMLAALLLALPARASSHARIVRLSYANGDVELDKGDGRGFGAAYLNMPLIHQSKLWTRDGEAEVELEDGSSIRLTPDTIVAFSDLSLDRQGQRNTQVELEQGTAYFDIRHRDADGFEVRVGRERVQVSKTARFRLNSGKDGAELAIVAGEVQASNASGWIRISQGETVRFESQDSDRYYLAKGIDPENYDSWDSERARQHDQELSAGANPSGAGYGLNDLNAYGNYFYVPGYGNMWRPASAGLGWDPFADRYWVSYPGFGYTFVSGYPWGWAPYRYGSWQFINGYGWCWAPGTSFNNWQAFPGVHNRPPHYHPLRPPRRGPPVLVVTNGVRTPLPARPAASALVEHRFPLAARIDGGNSVLMRPASAPVRGFAASLTPQANAAAPVSPRALAVPPITAAPAIVPPHSFVRPAEPRMATRASPVTPASRAPVMPSSHAPAMAPAPRSVGGSVPSHTSGPSFSGGGGGHVSGGGGGAAHGSSGASGGRR